MANLTDDTKKHADAQPLEEADAETNLGSEVASGSDDVSDVDQTTESMGLYEDESDSPDSGPENPAEVDIAKEIEKNNEG